LLVYLLERDGELVSREELQTAVWPEGTFVDFDRGMATALNKVREALGDSAGTPRFIETLPRRGYRFIGAIDKPRPQPAAADAPVARRHAPRPSRVVLAMLT